MSRDHAQLTPLNVLAIDWLKNHSTSVSCLMGTDDSLICM